MLIGFSSHTGAGKSNPAKGVIGYFTDETNDLTPEQKSEKKELRKQLKETKNPADALLIKNKLNAIRGAVRDPPPVVIKGDVLLTQNLINMVPHKRKYTSFMIDHAPEDNTKLQANPAIMDETRQLVEDMCFAGIKEEERVALWVQHTHKGHYENHIVVPFMHIKTGKSFNICPPGTNRDFDLIRSYINLKYDLADPDDPARARTTSINPNAPNSETKELINQILTAKICSGEINNKAEVVDFLTKAGATENSGFKVVTVSSNYISISIDGKDKNVRLKGSFYDNKFTDSSYFAAAIDEFRNAKAANRTSCLGELESKIRGRIEKRAEYNQRVYYKNDRETERTNDLDNEGKQQTNTRDLTSIEVDTRATQYNSSDKSDENKTDAKNNSESASSDIGQSSSDFEFTRHHDFDSHSEITGTTDEAEKWMSECQKQAISDAQKNLMHLKKMQQSNEDFMQKIKQLLKNIISIIGDDKYDRSRKTVSSITGRAEQFHEFINTKSAAADRRFESTIVGFDKELRNINAVSIELKNTVSQRKLTPRKPAPAQDYGIAFVPNAELNDIVPMSPNERLAQLDKAAVPAQKVDYPTGLTPLEMKKMYNDKTINFEQYKAYLIDDRMQEIEEKKALIITNDD